MSGLAPEAAMTAAMRAAQDGDRRAYGTLLTLCIPVIAAAARGRGVRGAAVDDVVQETLLALHRARASYDPARPFLPWLRAIAYNRAIDVARRNARQPGEVHDPIAYEGRADEGPAPDSGVGRREWAAHLAAAVAQLPEGQRQAVEHLAYRELSLAEASALTGRSTGALKVNLHRALRSLRTMLAPRKEDLDG